MFKLRYGYLISGIITGCILLFSFIGSFPDGKLHIFFCDVGQGDAAYIRLPDGRDMVVDGGPDDKVINCLSRHMPFWDRHLDIVALSHPQKDHLQGLISVFERYSVDYFVKSDIGSPTEGYGELLRVVDEKKVPVRLIAAGAHITLGPTLLSFVWPSTDILGATTGETNDDCLVFDLHYGTFDALFPGDADQHVENYYTGVTLPDNDIEVLKVPHHGSKTGMTPAFISWVHPKLAVISVGKNSFGHPTPEAIAMLQNIGARILRTDKSGDIEVVSDGRGWTVHTTK